MKSSSYWAAGHITSFFKIDDSDDDLLKKGSLGAGFNIKRGVITEVSISDSQKHKIYFNDHEKSFLEAYITQTVINLMNNYIPQNIFLKIKNTYSRQK